MTGESVFLLFYLGINGIRDIRRREIYPKITLLFVLFTIGFQWLNGRSLSEIWLGCLPGVMILSLAILTRGKIGGGDALVVLATGLCMGLYQTLCNLIGTLILILFWFLFSEVRNIYRKTKEKAAEDIPMIPFLFFHVLLWNLFR